MDWANNQKRTKSILPQPRQAKVTSAYITDEEGETKLVVTITGLPPHRPPRATGTIGERLAGTEVARALLHKYFGKEEGEV